MRFALLTPSRDTLTKATKVSALALTAAVAAGLVTGLTAGRAQADSRSASRIVSDLPAMSGRTLAADSATVTRGRVGSSRPVALQVLTSEEWTVLDTTRASSKGSFSIPLPTDWYGTHVVRTVAPRLTGAQSPEGPSRALYGPSAEVTVTPDFTPAPSTRFDLASIARWNPCAPITWTYSTAASEDGVGDQESAQGLAALRWAFTEASRATGITFTEVEATTQRPLIGHDVPEGAVADLAIGWATSTEIAEALGENYPGADPQRTAPDTLMGRVTDNDGAEYVAAGLLLNSDRIESRAFTTDRTATSWQATALREIGLMLGMTTIRDADSIMNVPGAASAIPSHGDLNGFRAVGLAAGCMAPSAR